MPKAADKGKGKAVEENTEEKPVLNGKKEDDKKDGRVEAGSVQSVAEC